ncbi:hypothetical protein OROGR_028932 [Orobanche gracilis]
MEKHHSDQTKVLSIDMSCCERCRKILKKTLLKMPGVDSVSIDMENNLVLVTGIVDAMTLLNKVAKLEKNVHLLPNDHHHSNNNHAERKQKDTRCRETVRLQKEKMQKEEHKCEPYEPPSVDARVCRDFFCKVHPRSRSIVDKVSGDRSSSFFGGFPTYSRGFGPSGGSYMDHMWYGENPLPPLYGHGHHMPPQFGGRRPPRMLPRPFNFQ